MRDRINPPSLALILVFFISGCSSEEGRKMEYGAKNVRLHDTVDLSFTSKQSYSAFTPWFNPFTEIAIRLTLTSPSGRTLVVPGFFDGDGNGGSTGRTFKVRLCPDETGVWNWQASSTLPEFDMIDGSFIVADRIDGVFARGPISVSKADPKHFTYANQEAVFLVGKFLDIDQPLPLRFSHTFFSESWSETERKQLFDHQLSLGINKINIYIANVGDYNSIPTTPWLGTSALSIKSRFDLGRWHLYENWIKQFRDAGIAVHLWFFADDSGFGNLLDSEKEQLVTYGMSRLSGYVNTVFTLALEWQEGFTENEVRTLGITAQKANPWRRLISVHGLSVSNDVDDSTTFFSENWLDFIELQTGFVDHRRIYELGNLYRNVENKPVILEEFSFGQNNDEQRVNTWTALLTTPSGIGTGSGLKAVMKFLEHVDITDFDTAAGIITSDNAYAAVSKDRIIVYAFDTGPLLFAPGKVNSENCKWFNPRAGRFSDHDCRLVKDQPLEPPTDRDWVLLINR